MQRIPAILLAAGLSSRMGGFKPLLRLGDAALIEHVLRSMRDSGAIGETIVVLGHLAGEIRGSLAGIAQIRFVVNENFAQGEMLSSVQSGIAALPGGTQGFLLAFADQPAVLPTTISRLVERFFDGLPPLVLPTYGQKRGHPVLISSALAAEILATRDPDTLKTVVHRHLPQAVMVEVPDSSIHEDLDTPEDFARAAAKYPSPPLR